MRRAVRDDLTALLALMSDFYSEGGYTLDHALAEAAFTAILSDERLGYCVADCRRKRDRRLRCRDVAIRDGIWRADRYASTIFSWFPEVATRGWAPRLWSRSATSADRRNRRSPLRWASITAPRKPSTSAGQAVADLQRRVRPSRESDHSRPPRFADGPRSSPGPSRGDAQQTPNDGRERVRSATKTRRTLV